MSKFVDSIVGHAIGDAMGVPTEFSDRKFLQKYPVVEMTESKYRLPAGSWSDDTSMEICIITSFIANKCFNYDDIMARMLEWVNDCEYTANNNTFDIGRTCLLAIRKFERGYEPLECGLTYEESNGNGSLVRSLPIALYSYYKNITEKEIIKITNDISSLTHAHEISKLGCYIYVRYIMFLLDGKTKEEAYELVKKVDYSSYSKYAISKYERILNKNIKEYKINGISSSGYVVHTLECALWIILNTNSFKEAIITSINMGDDTDSIGSITGSMAGIIYGIESFPKEWLSTLLRKDYLLELATKFENILIK